MSDKSDTPLTEAVNLHLRNRREYEKTDHQIWFEHGEALELRVNDLTEERDELLGTVETLEDLVKHLNETILDQENHIMELERLRRYSPGPHMGQD